MLVSLSDLHLQDIESQDPDTRSDQNVHHKAFIDFLQWISEEYLDKCKDETEIKIVLNGDIIDFLRTERWFNTPKRPYEDHHEKSISWKDPSEFPELDRDVDDILLEIFNVITGLKYGANYSKAPNVETIKALVVLRRFKREVNGEKVDPYPCETFEEFNKEYTKKLAGWVKKLIEKQANIQYIFIPGNHDRLVNVSSQLNKAFREFFLIRNSQGTFSPERFPWELHMEDYGVFLRHGHVYDWTNGEENLVFQRKDVKKGKYSFEWENGYKDSKLYYNTPIGDLITIDLITFMPYRFIEDYYKPKKPRSLAEICKRLREIDDVRPQPAVLPWLYEVTEGNEKLWEKIADVVKEALENTFFNDPKKTEQGEFFNRWNSTHDRRFFLDKSDLFGNAMTWAKRLLNAPSKLFETVYPLMEKLKVAGKDNPVPELIKEYIKRNKHPFMDSPQDYYVAGHIHSSSTHFLEEQKVYNCTGTWRTMHSRCLYKPEFKKMKSMNFIYFFQPNERNDPGGKVYIWRGLLEEEA